MNNCCDTLQTSELRSYTKVLEKQRGQSELKCQFNVYVSEYFILPDYFTIAFGNREDNLS
jgi:hypothetical protein